MTLRHERLEDGKNKGRTFRYGLYLAGREVLLRALLIVAFCVTAHKLIDATSGVNQLHLTGVERVRRVGNFHLIHGLGFAVHFDGTQGTPFFFAHSAPNGCAI